MHQIRNVFSTKEIPSFTHELSTNLFCDSCAVKRKKSYTPIHCNSYFKKTSNSCVNLQDGTEKNGKYNFGLGKNKFELDFMLMGNLGKTVVINYAKKVMFSRR